MPKPKDLSLISRNAQIRQMKDEGYTYQAIADTLGISRARVGQILASMDTEVSGDGYRAWLRAQGETGLLKLQEILRKPPPVKVAPNGRPCYFALTDEDGQAILNNHGQPLPDLRKPVLDDSLHLEAAKALPGLLDRLSKLYGLDVSKPKQMDDTPEMELSKKWVGELQEQNAQLIARLSRHERVEVEFLPPPPALVASGFIQDINPDDEIYDAEIIEDHDAPPGAGPSAPPPPAAS